MIMWLNGLFRPFNESQTTKDLIASNQYIIIFGNIGVGKTVYCKSISKHNKGVIYIEVQRLSELPLIIKNNASEIIEIRKVK